ncbi:MAG: DUF4918 family protein [Flavisolibacter sp.]|jgi:hypothetical protein|nr:DUF4918 family protein [Flavisolibacter sp.]
MNSWSAQLISYYSELHPPELPQPTEWLHPQKQEAVMEVVQAFYSKYYNDQKPRILFLGINPGRYGAGITGINFTAPRQLETCCGIDHPFKDQSELSAEFIYEMIHAFGGPADFFKKCFLGSVCPLGLIRNGKNINYYDDREVQKICEPFIINSMNRLLMMPVKPVAISLGEGKNYKYLNALNKKHKWFKEVRALPHPRYIMQYKRKEKQAFIGTYLEVIEEYI